MLEAECTRCKEIFVPHGVEPEDLIHGETFAGEACGGIGVVLGEWTPPGHTPQYYFSDRAGESLVLTNQEAHGIAEPHCSTPSCEFHHPELFGDTPFQEEDYTQHSSSC